MKELQRVDQVIIEIRMTRIVNVDFSSIYMHWEINKEEDGPPKNRGEQKETFPKMTDKILLKLL